jgi:Acyl-CoA dehydrogenase, C-terminal domain
MPDDSADIESLVRNSLKQALAKPFTEISSLLAEFGWHEFVDTDESFAFTALFEELGYLGADTNALDLAVAAVLSRGGEEPIVWPLTAEAGNEDGGSGTVTLHGVTLRGGLDGNSHVLAPVDGVMRAMGVSSVEEAGLGGMASESSWARVRVSGTPDADLGPWVDVERRALLAVASELVGLAQRIIEIAADQVSTRQQFGRAIGTYQAVRFRLAESYVEMAGARALVKAAWEDGSPSAARWAKTVAGTAHDVVAKHAIQVCGAIGLSHEHPLPALVRRGFALDALLKAASAHPAAIGRELLAAQPDTGLSDPVALAVVGGF